MMKKSKNKSIKFIINENIMVKESDTEEKPTDWIYQKSFETLSELLKFIEDKGECSITPDMEELPLSLEMTGKVPTSYPKFSSSGISKNYKFRMDTSPGWKLRVLREWEKIS